VIVIIAFGLLSLLFAVELASGTPLARGMCLFISLFWTARVYVPAPNKPWTGKGYCSKFCGVKEDGLSAIVTFDEEESPQQSKTVSVQCPAGHPFDVPISFSGLMRPCPQCKQKTRIPDTIS
jgi:hypothetical protein